MIPDWFFLALASSACAALGMHMHQRLNGSNLASAIWLKILAVLVAFPVLINYGLPDSPVFYAATAAAAFIWCINDLIYFRAVTEHGAALISRLAPLAIICTFVIWFFIKPDLLARYLNEPFRFFLISITILFATLCGMRVRKCVTSWHAIKSIWPIIVIVPVGSILVKISTGAAPALQGIFGYVGVEAAFMLIFYGTLLMTRYSGRASEVWSTHGVTTGAVVGFFLLCSVITRSAAMQDADHPAYVIMIGMLDIVWLMILSKWSGWKDDSNKIASLGIVLSALCIAILKIR